MHGNIVRFRVGICIGLEHRKTGGSLSIVTYCILCIRKKKNSQYCSFVFRVSTTRKALPKGASMSHVLIWAKHIKTQ